MSSSPALAPPANTFSWTLGAEQYRHNLPLPLPSSSTSSGSRPRLSSPRLFPSNFLTLPAPNVATRTQPFQRPEEDRDTGIHLERALESANTAINDAQEALEVRSSAMPPLVDLTAASLSQSPELQRHQQEATDYATHYPNNARPTDRSGSSRWSTSIEGLYNGIIDGMSVPRTRVETSGHNRVVREPYFPFGGRQGLLDPQERERQAIQRQRDARALWNSNQRRREALRQRRSRSRSPRRSSPPTRERFEDHERPGSSSRLKSESPVESIDLTAVDESMSAADILAKQRSDAVASQKVSSDTGRTPLTSYKCPICMETPTDVTATICGHLFCHRCIIDTLKWSEDQRGENHPSHRPKGVCPVCRKELKRIDIDQKGRTLVPLSIMLGQQMRKERKTDVKGKGVALHELAPEDKKRESTSEWMDRLVNLEDI